MDDYGLTVSIPAEMPDEEWERMKALFAGKIELERHAFQAPGIFLRREGAKISISGLPLGDADYTQAACQYLERLAVLAHEAKRVNRTSGEAPENEKYAFRTWLLRLGFIGDKYKKSRTLLLRSLPGTASRKEVKS